MSHFAEIDGNNKVIRVLVGDNSMPNEGLDWLIENLGGIWIQTSYNNNIRFNYAGIGYTYDEGRDAFIAPKPYPSWLLDEATCQWQAPTPMPTDDKRYEWDEANLQWSEIPGINLDGSSFAPDIDAFVPPKCHNEAVLDEVIAQWICNNPDHTKEITSE